MVDISAAVQLLNSAVILTQFIKRACVYFTTSRVTSKLMGIRLLYKMMNVNKLYPKLSEVVSVEENQNICIALVSLHCFLLFYCFEIFLIDAHKKNIGLCIPLEIQVKIAIELF